MEIEVASGKDYRYLLDHDRYLRPEQLRRKLDRGEIIVIREGGLPVGWLRYGYFWDTIPFMNMLYVTKERRGQGVGARLVHFWERKMALRQKWHKDRIVVTWTADIKEQGDQRRWRKHVSI